jgi:2-oxoglutarate dehydrogenase E2 component (dihydrolipoamide succinyltransferase)
MSTEVVMPQMGESIAEGTITRWLKKVGDHVDRDEPLFEISTDKVDAEIPSPAAGTLSEIKFNEGDTVEVNTVVAVLNGGDGASASPAAPAASSAATPAKIEAPADPVPAPSAQAAVSSEPPPAPAPAPSPAQMTESKPSEPAPAAATPQAAPSGLPTGEQSAEELRRLRSSPLVRNIAKEHGIDISRLEGTGMSGRVTKNDILSFIESGAALTPQQAMQVGKAGAQPSSGSAAQQARDTTVPAPPPGVGDRVEPMSVMRKKIADHMIMSRRTSAHVTTVYEIDMTRIAKIRDKYKREFFERTGTKLTYMPFIFQAVTTAIRKFPVFNAQVSGDQIIYKRDINLGMAVALDWGLIVPVVKRADELSIAGLARAANDLADRARAKQLKPDDVAGGTFTITNPGVFGGLFGTPIINQPQVAILGVGAIEKRAKVVTSEEGDDNIAIRLMAYFALTFDHRIIDGSDAERFLGFVKELLEAGQFSV